MKKGIIYILLFLAGCVNLKSQEVELILNKFYFNSQKELILDYSIINKTSKNLILFGDLTIDDTPLYMNYSKLHFFKGDSLVLLKNSLRKEERFRKGIPNKTVIYSLKNSTMNNVVNLTQYLLPDEIAIIDSLYRSYQGGLFMDIELFSWKLMSMDNKTKRQVKKKMRKEKFQKFIGTIYSNKVPLEFE